MRSTVGVHAAGAGTLLAFVEPEESYFDRRVAVRLPSDHLKGAALAALSGPVTTYNLYAGGVHRAESRPVQQSRTV